jgi:hypothetical protein
MDPRGLSPSRPGKAVEFLGLSETAMVQVIESLHRIERRTGKAVDEFILPAVASGFLGQLFQHPI